MSEEELETPETDVPEHEIGGDDNVSRHLGALLVLLTLRYRERLSSFFQRRATSPAFQRALDQLSLPSRIEGEGPQHSAYGLSADWDRVLGAEFGMTVAALPVPPEEVADLLAAALTVDELYALLPDLPAERAVDVFEHFPDDVRRRLFDALVNTEDGQWVADRWWDGLPVDTQARLARLAKAHGVVAPPFPQAYDAFNAYEERFLARALGVVDNDEIAGAIIGAPDPFREKLLRNLPDVRRADVQWDAKQWEEEDGDAARNDAEAARRTVLRVVAAELKRLTGK